MDDNEWKEYNKYLEEEIEKAINGESVALFFKWISSKKKKLEYHKKYYTENLKGNKWHCDMCDCDVSICHKSRHIQTKKHIEKQNNI